MRRVDAADEFASLFNSDLRCFAFDHLQSLTSHRCGRVQDDDVPGDERIEEVPQCGQMQLFSGRRIGEGVQVQSHVTRRDASQVEPCLSAMLQEPAHSVRIRPARARIANLPVDEFIPRKLRCWAFLGDERRRLRIVGGRHVARPMRFWNRHDFRQEFLLGSPSGRFAAHLAP